MISLLGSAAAGLLLLTLLWRVWLRSNTTGEFPYGESAEREKSGDCPMEILSRVFGHEDREFIDEFRSKALKAAFQRERKLIAQTWVRETMAEIRTVIREHGHATRTSHDLQIGIEARIYLRYSALQMACVFLFLLIRIAGPTPVRQFSLYVYRMAERLNHTHELLLASATKQFSDAGNF
jgi:hypothetical protein